ncbi:MAG: hypothetical protein PHQ19_02150 [Candidatus Krumholzibacteria bacterium]|nr:hypothetical protein [Candidatus Krumholzibacteria bacterium]
MEERACACTSSPAAGRGTPRTHAARRARAALLAAAVLAAGCSADEYLGEMRGNEPPVVYLSNGPLEGDTTCYSVHFFWLGEDGDGAIDHYEIAVVDGDPIGFHPADTTGPEKWTRTVSTDSALIMTADDYDTSVVINQSLYGKFQKTHTFFIRAVDDRGAVSETAFRSFTAYTLAPNVYISYPKMTTNPDLGAQRFSMITTFRWYGKDPIDQPWNYQEVDSVRFLHMPYSSSLEVDLNANPERYEHLWSRWYWYHHPGDSGQMTVIGDDELLTGNSSYAFVVQAKDDAGAVSSVFSKRTNIRHFMPMTPTGPLLVVREPYMGSFSFLGVDMRGEQFDVPPGFLMRFRWTADASSYGGVVSGYRYGWDVEDLNNPGDWACASNPYILSAVPQTFYSGVHTLYIEATDNLGTRTLGTIQVDIIPVVMTRDVLWIDDMPSSEFASQLYAFPRESEHDRFWMDILLMAENFDPGQDVYDVLENHYYPPPMDLIWKYRNVIWTYSRAYDPEAGSYWNKLVKYTPEGSATQLNLNYLPYYLAYGGHLWTEGEGHRSGGLAAVMYLKAGQIFPNYIRCEFGGASTNCSDTTGAGTMAYRDFCVTVIDKVEGVIKPYVPVRSREFDGLHHAVLERYDPVVALMEGFPKKLELWEQVTAPGYFFDPADGGFHFVELYDTWYYMRMINKSSQRCFHPLYRQVSMNTRSVLNEQPIAFWHTRYAGVVPSPPGCVAAPSVHFGMPLWYFNRAQVDSIARAIFNVWQIPVAYGEETVVRRSLVTGSAPEGDR